MPKLQLRPLTSAEAIARDAATEMVGLLLRRADLSVPFGVALSGGRIAVSFYEAVVRAAQQRALFENVHFFWADERCVPPNDAENNYSVARNSLFKPLTIPEEQIHRIRGEIDLDFAVREAEAELCRLMPLSESGQPILDLVILGMGEDGHVASLFPSEGAEWIEDSAVYRAVVAVKPPPRRITLGYQPIIAAREAWVLAAGRGKAAALERLQRGDEALPISRIAARRRDLLVWHETV
jgi:6-phosphogluconolactonase